MATAQSAAKKTASSHNQVAEVFVGALYDDRTPMAGSPGSYICSGVALITVFAAFTSEWKKT